MGTVPTQANTLRVEGMGAHDRFRLMRGEDIQVKCAHHTRSDLVGDYGRRLALVNVDWACIRAVDVYAILNSCARKLGVVEDVSVYLSQYAEQSSRQESLDVPRRSNLMTSQVAPCITPEGRHRTEEVAYPSDVFRTHFAIATFDSTATALHVYNECDATELPHSSAPLDLRFVPDEAQFTHLQVCDKVCSLPVGYEPIAIHMKVPKWRPSATGDFECLKHMQSIAHVSSPPYVQDHREDAMFSCNSDSDMSQ